MSLEFGALDAPLPIDLFEWLNASQHLPNNPQQRLHHRRAVFRPNFGKLQLPASQGILYAGIFDTFSKV